MGTTKQIVPTFREELVFWSRGFDIVIGIDEVGRGAFAGPLVVGAVVFSPSVNVQLLKDVRDSKMLLPNKREALQSAIKELAIATEITEIAVNIINKVGIGKANQMGFRKVIAKMRQKFLGKRMFVLVDGFHARYARGIGLKNQKAIIKGDQKSFSIAAASIIAKVYRDALMEKEALRFPAYRFDKHKGYGTSLHRNLLQKHGLSTIHRTAFCSHADF